MVKLDDSITQLNLGVMYDGVAVTGENDLDVEKMNKLFDKERCIVKITPIHETVEAVKNGYEIIHTFDVYEKYEKPLVEAGWDVIVFVPSQEEDEDEYQDEEWD